MKFVKAKPEDVKIKRILIHFNLEVCGVEAGRYIEGRELSPELRGRLKTYLAQHVTGFKH